MKEVFYRKWRPRRLDEVVGQEVVARTLRNAVESGNTAHAYLFCGPRGTGKTSTARVLAKALNCESTVGGEPDDSCNSCVSIRQSRALDLIEIDAASNRGIDDMRSLREKVHFAPNESRKKVYIIDEVHMLTEPAFNALLKTLEEPPLHAVFILATTDIHKVPPTVISRCQRFDFRRIALSDMTSRLMRLCKDEGVNVDEKALNVIARSSSGSLRDAENLLEQALVSYGSPLLDDHIRELLGLNNDEQALNLVGHIFSGSLKEGLNLVHQVFTDGADVTQFHRVLVECLRSALLIKSGVKDTSVHTLESQSRLENILKDVSIEQVVQVLDKFVQTDLGIDSTSSLRLELTLVECSFLFADGIESDTKTFSGLSDQVREVDTKDSVKSADSEGVFNGNKEVVESIHVPDELTVKSSEPPGNNVPDELTVKSSEPPDKLVTQWGSVLKELKTVKGRRFNLGALLRSSTEKVIDGDTIVLKYSHVSHLERMQEELRDSRSRDLIKEVLQKNMNASIDVRAELIDAVGNESIGNVAQRSHLVKAAQNLGASVISEKEDVVHDE